MITPARDTANLERLAVAFDALVVDAETHFVGETEALVISVATWERLKEASGRAKDLEHLDRFRDRPR